MIFKKLIEKYKERYSIPLLSLADAAETNRIHVFVISHLLFLFGILDVAGILILHHDNLKKYTISLIYFGAFTLLSLASIIYSYLVKYVSREKAYAIKSVPAYLLYFISLGAAVYNFYVLGQPFNGVLTYFLAGFLSLYVFTLSPNKYFLGLVAAMGVMAPGIYSNFGFTGLVDSLLAPFLMYTIALYKRRIEKKHILFLNQQKKSLEAKTFGNFTLIYENKVIKFSRSKSAELLGYLIYKRGSSANSKELINVLWGEHADSARYGGSLRNLIIDIRNTLKELEIQNFFISEYNNFRINPEIIRCDYYDFLEGDKAAIHSYAGEFMNQFSWAEETAAFLSSKVTR